MADQTITTPASTTPTTTPGGNVSAAGNNTDFMNALQDQLMKSAGAVSSNASTIDTSIQGAISSLNQSQATTDKGLAAGHQSDINAATQTGNNNMTAEMEARRGMATNTGIVQNIQQTTNKNLADLDLKYQQAISSGDAATASKVADLQVQALTLRQDTLQKAFTNQLGIAGAMNTAKQTQIAEQGQTFAEQQAMSSMALQYGVALKPGDTLQSVAARATPMASREEQAKIALTLAQTHQANAVAAKAIADAKNNQLNATDIASIGQSYIQAVTSGNATSIQTIQGILNNLATTNPAQANSILASVHQQSSDAIDPDKLFTNVANGLQSGKYQTLGDAQKYIASLPGLTPQQINAAYTTAQKAFEAQQSFANSSAAHQGATSKTVFGRTVWSDSTNVFDQLLFKGADNQKK